MDLNNIVLTGFRWIMVAVGGFVLLLVLFWIISAIKRAWEGV